MLEFKIEDIPSQSGKIAIVTGANTGIGFETALALAKKDFKVIMACRNLGKAEKARLKILGDVPGADLKIMAIDLSSLTSVREFANSYISEFDQIDLLINNAGIMIPPYSKTQDGFESQMGSNYFGHFLLTGLLLNVLSNTQGSRIVSLSSIAHKKGQINFDDIHWEKAYSAMKAYRQSKLACLIFAFELQRRLEKSQSGTISVAAHPGVSQTDLFKYVPKWMQHVLFPLFSSFIQPAKQGAQPILNAALGSGVSGGEYYGPQGKNEMKGVSGLAYSTPLSRDEEIAKQLWSLSEKLTGIRFL